MIWAAALLAAAAGTAGAQPSPQGYLGVSLRFEMTPLGAAAYPSGVVVAVEPGSPAQQASLRPGDAILRICAQDGACENVPPVGGEQWFGAKAGAWPAGTRLQLYTVRAGTEHVRDVTLGVRGAPAPGTAPASPASSPAASAPAAPASSGGQSITELAAVYERLCGQGGSAASSATCEALRKDLSRALQGPAPGAAAPAQPAPSAGRPEASAGAVKPEDQAYRSPVNAASVQAASGDVAGAIATLRTHLATGVPDASARAELARYLRQQGEDDAALDEVSKAIAIDPANPEARNLRIALLMKRRAYAEALDDFDALIADGYANAATYLNRGVTNHNLQALPEAIADYDRALVMDPGNALAHINKGAVLVQMHQERQAIPVLTQGLALDPRSVHGYLTRGIAYSNLRDTADAAQDFGSVIELQPDNRDALVYRAQAFRSARQYPEAIRDYDRLIALYPGEADMLVQRGNCNADMGDWARALTDYDRALSVEPSNQAIQSRRAVAQSELGKRTAAPGAY